MDMKNSDVAVIVPVYNEEKVIAQTISGALKVFPLVVCVDDGSTDGSADQIAQTGACLVQHSINLGQGAALQTGIDFALQNPDVKYFVTYDADGQHNLADVQKMLDLIRTENIDIVVGSRFLGKAENMGTFKRFLLKLAVAFSNRTTGLALTDTHNGLRVCNRKVASELKLTMPDFAHASEIIERIAEKKFSYKEVPVTIVYTDYSRAKGQSMLNAINITFDLLLNRLIKK
jgi:glycosyltransferase involved in cell wall biosynthesis